MLRVGARRAQHLRSGQTPAQKPSPRFTSVRLHVPRLAFALTSSDTRARPPSRTLVDPLETFIQSLRSKGLSGAADEAHAAADKTKELVAKAGRGAYVNQEDLKKSAVPDPGAWGIWRIVDGLRGYEAK